MLRNFFIFVAGSESPGKAYEAFLARLNYLQDLLHEKDLKENERFCDMSQELLGRLEGLQKIITSDDRLTCGGKFEWVDSILVKVRIFFLMRMLALLRTLAIIMELHPE